MKLPIVAGPLRGRWWLPQSGGKVVRVLRGAYEPEQTQLFREWITTGATVMDIGAHVGYYTLLASVLAGTRGRVCAFEPNPENHEFLRRHVALNGMHHVHIENAAVSDHTGAETFAFGSGSGTGRLATDGTLSVRTVRLDDFCREHQLDPGVLKIDVEGAELNVLRGAADVIGSSHPVIFLSTHGLTRHEQCLTWLRERSYTVHAIGTADLATANEVLCTWDRKAA